MIETPMIHERGTNRAKPIWNWIALAFILLVALLVIIGA
jgi:hypothetical protein